MNAVLNSSRPRLRPSSVRVASSRIALSHGCVALRFDEVAERELYSARYSRVAMLEAVLSIRDRQKLEQRMVVAGLCVTGVVAIVAGLLGWF